MDSLGAHAVFKDSPSCHSYATPQIKGKRDRNLSVADEYDGDKVLEHSHKFLDFLIIFLLFSANCFFVMRLGRERERKENKDLCD